MTTDPIADLLTRLRNSLGAGQKRCAVPASKAKEGVLKVLKQKGFIQNYVRQELKPQDELVVTHKYLGKKRKSVVTAIKRVSKPGCRIYRGYRDIRPLLSGIGVTVFSTPLGILSDAEAVEKKVGGEVLCEVW